MDNIGFSYLYNSLNKIKDEFKTKNAVNSIQVFELISNAIRELQVSLDTISTLESKLAQATVDLARFKFELDRERALMGEILRQSPAGIVIVEAPSGKAIRINRTAKMIMGKENVLSRNIEDHKSVRSPFLFHLDQTPCEFEEMPIVRSLIHREVVTNEELIYIRDDGTEGILSISSSPVFDNEAKEIAAVATFYGVTKPNGHI